ncbi:MAG: tetratricopeptide repeat protein [Candidatus Sigynarchaeota archaeon]
MTIDTEGKWFSGKIDLVVEGKGERRVLKCKKFMLSQELVPIILAGRPFMNFGVYLTIITLNLEMEGAIFTCSTDSRYEFLMDSKRMSVEFPCVEEVREGIPAALLDAIISSQPMQRVMIHFKDRDLFETFSQIINQFIANEHFKNDYHFFKKVAPKCECGMRKAIGGEYSSRLNNWPDKMKTDAQRIQPWHLEFICLDCMLLYLKMEEHLKRSPPWNPLETLEMEMAAEGMVKIAVRLGDRLSIAHANVMVGMVYQGTEKAVKSLTEALVLLREHQSYKSFGFYQNMLWSYNKAIAFLARSLFTLGKYNEALIIFRERQEACERFGTALESSFTRVEIGQTLARLGRTDEGEREIAAGLEGMEKAGVRPLDRRYIHSYLVYVDIFYAKNDMAKVDSLLDELVRKGGAAIEESEDYQRYRMAVSFKKGLFKLDPRA